MIHYYAWQAYSEALGACPAEIDDPEIHDPIIDFAEHTPTQLYNALCKLRALAFGLPKSASRGFIIVYCQEAMRRLEKST